MSMISVCGTDCSTCYCYGELCKGCNELQGKVFHIPEGKACRIYECTVNTKKYSSCGKCDKLPCDIWRSTRDPKFSDEEFEENIRERMSNLQTNYKYNTKPQS